MTKSSNKFVVSKKDIVAPQEIMVEKGDVGVRKSEDKNHASVFFIRIWKQVELSTDDFEVIDVEKQETDFLKKFVMFVINLRKLKISPKIKTRKITDQCDDLPVRTAE